MTNRDLAGIISEMSRLVVTLRQAAGENPSPAQVVPCSSAALQAASDQVAKWHNQLLDLMDQSEVAVGRGEKPASTPEPA